MEQIKSKSKVAFTYTVEHLREGELLHREVVTNLVPTEGMNHILNVILNGGTQQANWYVALYEGNYTPVAGLTAATFVAAATECVAYTSATRVAWTSPSGASAGAISNSTADFVLSADKTVYGAALVSVGTKSSGAGVLLSAVRFATAKTPESGDTLRIAAGLTLVSE